MSGIPCVHCHGFILVFLPCCLFGLFAYLLCVLSSHAFPAPIVQSSILGRTYGLRMTGHSARCPRCERRWLDLPRIRPRGEHLGRSLAKNRDSGRRHGVRGQFYIGMDLVVNCELAVMSPPRCLILSSPTGISGNGLIGDAGGIGSLRVHKACYSQVVQMHGKKWNELIDQ